MQTSSFIKNNDLQEKYSKLPVENPYIVFPALFGLMGDISCRHVLDIGCGDGTFSALMADKGAVVKGIDIADNWIEHCRKEYQGMPGLFFERGDGRDLSGEAPESYDIAVMNMVLLMVERKDDLLKIFRQTGRILKPGGCLIFSDLHPLCKIIEDTPTQKQQLPDNFSYFTEGSQYNSQVRLSDGSYVGFVDIHWNLETFAEAALSAGLFIEKISEPKPVHDAPELFDSYKIPEYIIFKCRKYS